MMLSRQVASCLGSICQDLALTLLLNLQVGIMMSYTLSSNGSRSSLGISKLIQRGIKDIGANLTFGHVNADDEVVDLAGGK